MNRAIAVAAVTVLSACAVNKYRPPAGNTAYGSYPFKQILSDANPPMTLEGTVVMLPDTVMMTLWGKSCVSITSNATSASFNYSCGDINFRLGKANPLRTASYHAPTVLWKMRSVCDMYRENPTTKAEVCSRYRQERYESHIILQGSLTFLPR